MIGSISNWFNKYSAASAPFAAKLMSNTVGWITVRRDDRLATSFLYPAMQGLLPD